MMRSRQNRPGLIGTAARTAVITKTATSVAGSSAAQQQARAHQAELAHSDRMAAAAPGAPAPAPAGGLTPDKIEQLKQLAELKTAGILSDVEFEVQKARLLA